MSINKIDQHQSDRPLFQINYYDKDSNPGSYSHDDGNGDDDDDSDGLFCDSRPHNDSECDSDVENSVEDAIHRDDFPELVAILDSLFGLDDFNRHMEPGKPCIREPILCPRFVVALMCTNSMTCATALLQRQTCVYVDLNVLLNSRSYPLHWLALYFNCELVDLFLSYGARADVKTDVRSIPLKTAFDMLSTHLYLHDWTPEESIFKLVIILCLPQMRVALETIKLLALSTKDVNEIFIEYAKNGMLIEMAVLLLVANELVMPRSTFHSEDGDTVERVMNIRHTITGHILSQVDEESEESVCASKKRSNLAQLCKSKRETLLFTLMMLKLFERAGDAIRSYLRSLHRLMPKEGVVKDVALILKKAGFLLKEKDIDLSNIDCESDNVKRITGTSENTATYTSNCYFSMVMFGMNKSNEKRRNEVVVRDFASILKEAGFMLKDKDMEFFYLANIDCESNQMKETARISENIEPYKSEEGYRVLDLWNDKFLKTKENPITGPQKVQVILPLLHRFPWPSSSCSSRHFCNSASWALHKNPFHGEPITLQLLPPRPTLRNLLRFTSSLKRVMRRV